MRFFLLFTLGISVFASKRLPKEFRYKTEEQIRQILTKKSDVIVNRSSAVLKNIPRRVTKKKFVPKFDAQKKIVRTLEKFKASIQGNIISSGRPVSITIIPDPNPKLPRGSYFACTGVNWAQKYDYRLVIECNKLVTPKNEYTISASIKDEFLTDGLKPLEGDVYDGSEESILGTAIHAGFQSIIESLKPKESTLSGERNKNRAGTHFLSGIQAGTSKANEEMLNKAADRKLVLTIRKNRRVVIEFKERFFYEL